MKAPPDHAAYLEGFQPECTQPPGWTDRDWRRLMRYGRWYEALVGGALAPLSDDQRNFVALFRGDQQRDAETLHEQTWSAYLRRIDPTNVPQMNSGLSLRAGGGGGAKRLPNGDDDKVYFVRRKRR